MSQAINLRAMQWAYNQEGLSVTAKAVLMIFAIHANKRGYTWPGVDHIASGWGMDRKTIRRQIEALLVRRLICRTKKRVGATGQVKVYRLPKVTYESGGKSTRIQNDGSGAKESLKSPISGGEFLPNNGMMEQRTKNHDKGRAVRNSIPRASSNAESGKSFFVGSYQNQNQPTQNHVKFPEFAAWCRSRGGQPHEHGFWKWLNGQKPQWRNKVRQNFEETGYVLDGKFFTDEQANQMGRENSELLTKFRRAARRGSKIEHLKPNDSHNPKNDNRTVHCSISFTRPNSPRTCVSPFPVNKRSQLFIRTHDEMLSRRSFQERINFSEKFSY